MNTENRFFCLNRQRRFRYIELYRTGELAKRVDAAKKMLSRCTICPRACEANRLNGHLGFCKSGSELVVSSHTSHHGEEPPLSGRKGSGTIFFTGCNLRCLFCQNYQISQLYEGIRTTTTELAEMMLELQNYSCHNINLVSPTHFVPQILEALLIAIGKGLILPIVYNTNGYDTIETLKLLDGIVDIYLPDLKYTDENSAKECSGAEDYVKYNLPAIKEMHRQVGNLVMDEGGIAISGLIVRHLVLPENLSGSFAAIDFLADEISREVYVSLMSQYHPCHKADTHPVLSRPITGAEYKKVVEYAISRGLENCWVQPLYSAGDYLPDFKKKKPFNF